MSAEESILNGLPPAADLIDEPAEGAAASPPCFDHGRPDCAECRERILRAKEVAEARRRETSEQSSPANPPPPELEVPKPPTIEAPIVALAKEYSGLLEQIQRNEKLLIGAQERVAFLLNSISESKLAAETARLAIVKYATAE